MDTQNEVKVDNSSLFFLSGDKWEPMPSYGSVAADLVKLLNNSYLKYRENSYRFPADISQDFDVLFNFSRLDIVLILGISIGFTVLRSVLTKYVLLPLGRSLQLTPQSTLKLPESVWKLVYYGLIWCYTFRILVSSGEYRFFQNPSSVWKDFSTSAPIPADIYWLYALQGSFYIHSVYALFFQDAWRNDSPIMGVHHVVTIVLLWCSFTCRYHNIGALTMFFHDFCDVELEFAKVNVYLKVRAGKNFKLHDTLAAISFLAMTVTWFIGRLYYFPLKVLYSCSTVLLNQSLYPDYTLLMVSMLLLLTCMNIFWFSQMLVFLYKIFSGELEEVDDIREFDVVEKLERSSERSSKDKKVD